MIQHKIVIEGGGDSSYLHSLCRRAFRKLFESCGFSGRMPRLVAGGGRDRTYKDFKNFHYKSVPGDFIGMLIDSEDLLVDTDKTWDHLQTRDGWEKPSGAEDKQVLFMTTCMETWVAADRPNLHSHYGSDLQKNALPSNNDLETVSRSEVYKKLAHATRNCNAPYKKGEQSFKLLESVSPSQLNKLPSFNRVLRILDEKLK